MEDFRNLKAGDKVLLSYDACIGWTVYTTYREETVEKVTPSGLIVVCGMKFYPDSGRERKRGRCYHICHIEDETARILMDSFNQKKTVQDVLNRFTVEKCKPTYEQALKIKEIMGWEQ